MEENFLFFSSNDKLEAYPTIKPTGPEADGVVVRVLFFSPPSLLTDPDEPDGAVLAGQRFSFWLPRLRSSRVKPGGDPLSFYPEMDNFKLARSAARIAVKG